jgi:hypothetical protein
MIGTTPSEITFFMQRFHNLGLMETNRERFLVIKENKLTITSLRLPRAVGIYASSAIFLFGTFQ